MIVDELVHLRLSELRIITLIVTMSAVTDHIDEYIIVELLAVCRS